MAPSVLDAAVKHLSMVNRSTIEVVGTIVTKENAPVVLAGSRRSSPVYLRSGELRPRGIRVH